MSRLVISMLFFCLLTSHMSRTKAAGLCNFVDISECWKDILSKYCEKDGVCEEDPDYCRDKEILAECYRVNCDITDTRELGWVSLFTGDCYDRFLPVMRTVSKDD